MNTGTASSITVTKQGDTHVWSVSTMNGTRQGTAESETAAWAHARLAKDSLSYTHRMS